MLLNFTYSPETHISACYLFLEMEDTTKAAEVAGNACQLFPDMLIFKGLHAKLNKNDIPTQDEVQSVLDKATSDLSSVIPHPLLKTPLTKKEISELSKPVPVKRKPKEEKKQKIKLPKPARGKSTTQLIADYETGDSFAANKIVARAKKGDQDAIGVLVKLAKSGVVVAQELAKKKGLTYDDVRVPTKSEEETEEPTRTSAAEGEVAVSQIASSRRSATLLAMTDIGATNVPLPVSMLTGIDPALMKGRVFNISVGKDILSRYKDVAIEFKETLGRLFPDTRFNLRSNGDGVIRTTCTKDTREEIGSSKAIISNPEELTAQELLEILTLTLIGSAIPKLNITTTREEEMDWSVDYKDFIIYINQLHLSLTGKPCFTQDELTSFTKGDHVLINKTIKKIKGIHIHLSPIKPVERMTEDEVLEVLRAV